MATRRKKSSKKPAGKKTGSRKKSAKKPAGKKTKSRKQRPASAARIKSQAKKTAMNILSGAATGAVRAIKSSLEEVVGSGSEPTSTKKTRKKKTRNA